MPGFNSWSGNAWGGVKETIINSNAEAQGKKGYIYIAGCYSSSGDSTAIEFGVLRVGYNGNHVTKNKLHGEVPGLAFSTNSNGNINYTSTVNGYVTVSIFG